MARQCKSKKAAGQPAARPNLGCCGLDCSQCPGFLAAQTNDRALAQKTAEDWSRQFHIQVAVDQVWCDGCTRPGRKCAHCAECELRTCALGRKLDHCGQCADYPCPSLTKFFDLAPVARQGLERLRAS